MNILLTTETYLPYITGVSSSTDSIARYMVGQGHGVTLVSPRPVIKGEVKHVKNLKFVLTPSVQDFFYHGKSTAIFPLTLFTIYNEMKKTKFDIVHIQESGSIGLSALILAKIYKIPTVGALHFIPEQIDRVIFGSLDRILSPIVDEFVRIVFNLYDSIMTPSNYFAGYLRRVGIKKPIYVISNGVDISKWKK